MYLFCRDKLINITVNVPMLARMLICVFRMVCVRTLASVLPSSKDTSFGREGTAEAIRERGNGLRSPFLYAPETNQPEQRQKKRTLLSESKLHARLQLVTSFRLIDVFGHRFKNNCRNARSFLSSVVQLENHTVQQ